MNASGRASTSARPRGAIVRTGTAIGLVVLLLLVLGAMTVQLLRAGVL